MTITINTLDYIKTYNVNIDKEDFVLREANTAESIAMTSLQAEAMNGNAKAVEKILDIIYGLFDKPEQVREKLKDVSFESLIQIIEDIKKGEA